MRSTWDSIGSYGAGWSGMRKDKGENGNMRISNVSELGMHQGSTNGGHEQHSPKEGILRATVKQPPELL